MSDEALFKDISGKIERERRLIDGYTRVRQSSNNPQVQSSTDVQIRDARRNIQYFESKLKELQTRRGMNNLSLGGASNGRPQQPGRGQPQPGYQPYGPESVGSRRDYGAGGYSDPQVAETGPRRAPYDPPAPGAPPAKSGQRYTRLDLIKDDSPHLGPRIQLMLSQLQFKLNVEKQYKDGIDKIVRSYSMDGDRKIGQEASGKRVESMQKIQLLSQALKRYEDLNVGMEDADAADDDSVTAPALRKALTGVLSMKIHAISDVNHATAGRFSRGPESFVIVKVEDETKSRTKATRTDKWADENLDIDIDKGNEVELTVYDKAGGDHPRPVGLLWIRISDVAEEMRRKKIEHDFNQAGWVSADKMDNGGPGRLNVQFQPPPGQMPTQGPGNAMGQAYGASGPAPNAAPVPAIDAWFSLEPVGRIHLTLNFAKETREKTPFDVNGIRRKGAVRQRKEEIHELYGHKFVAQTFYNVMRCAFCGGLLKYDTGMQCSDCKYMCHEKCYPKVVTKCISRPNAESDPDEAKLNHRIPHRFEAYGNISANWCCHCGYLLPLGRKQPRRCRECKTTAHAHCTHLVPDLCGMTMDQITQILGAIKDVRSRPAAPRSVRTLRAQPPRPRPSLPDNQSTMSLSMSESTLVDQSPRVERLSYKEGETNEQATYRPPSGSVTASNFPPNPPPKAADIIHKRPVPPRTDSSSTAAQAAAKALQAKNQTSPTESRPPYASRASSGYPTSPRAPQVPPAPQHAAYDPSAYAGYDGRQPAQQQYQQPVHMPQAPVIEPPRQPAAYPPPNAVQPLQPAALSTSSSQKDPGPPAQTKGRGPRVGLDHFNFLAVLGKGNFGKVMLAETKATKQLYAIKVLKKEFIIENDEVESTKSERDVFIIANKARHPFLLNLHACFQTETRVYFVMEYISGGDLMLHIQRGQFGLKRAQFYAAEVCLALKYFHENGVVYRDLKLDNILLTLDGHIKIADYGLCKKDMHYGSTTSTFCGTPEFMAPEILLDKKYGRAVDWWAFGVLIYQMLLQQSPFRGEDEDEIYDAILADEPLYPIHMPRDSVSILQKLLTREPEMRLGSGPTDAQEIMAHSFFRNVNWEDIAEKRVPAPFLPQIRSATDTSNFDSEFTSVTPVLTPVQSVLSQAMQEEFRGFSYSADFV